MIRSRLLLVVFVAILLLCVTSIIVWIIVSNKSGDSYMSGATFEEAVRDGFVPTAFAQSVTVDDSNGQSVLHLSDYHMSVSPTGAWPCPIWAIMVGMNSQSAAYIVTTTELVQIRPSMRTHTYELDPISNEEFVLLKCDNAGIIVESRVVRPRKLMLTPGQ